MKKLLKTLILSVLLVSPVCLADEEFIGIIVASRGDVQNQDGDKLTQGGYVYLDDTILTDKRSFIVIQLTDGSKITIRPDTTVKLDEYAYNGTTEDNMQLDLIQGGLRIVSGSIAKTSPEQYTINTPVALMGVRGTEFSILLCGEAVCSDE